MGDGGRETYPIEAVLLKKELDHEDELMGKLDGRVGWAGSVTGKTGLPHRAHETLSLLLCNPATVAVEDSAKSEAAEMGSIVSCPE